MRGLHVILFHFSITCFCHLLSPSIIGSLFVFLCVIWYMAVASHHLLSSYVSQCLLMSLGGISADHLLQLVLIGVIFWGYLGIPTGYWYGFLYRSIALLFNLIICLVGAGGSILTYMINVYDYSFN